MRYELEPERYETAEAAARAATGNTPVVRRRAGGDVGDNCPDEYYRWTGRRWEAIDAEFWNELTASPHQYVLGVGICGGPPYRIRAAR
jgi:hypothetical protein